MTAQDRIGPPEASDAAVEALSEWGVDESDVAAIREAAVEGAAWKLLDLTSDLADREPSAEAVRAASADVRAALPHLAAVSSVTREDVETEWHVEVRADGLIYDATFDTEDNARKAWDDQPDGVLIRTEHTRWAHDAITPRAGR